MTLAVGIQPVQSRVQLNACASIIPARCLSTRPYILLHVQVPRFNKRAGQHCVQMEGVFERW